MTSHRDDDEPSAYSSPPCFMHELDPAYAGHPAALDPKRHEDVLRWRRAERKSLIAKRQALSDELKRDFSDRIADHLDRAVGDVEAAIVSVYWPFDGEPDLLPWMGRICDRGGRCALPVIVERKEPLVFRAWRPGEALVPGIWDIPMPADGDEVVPDIVVAPLVGFDPQGFRLGHGGGYYDRTLAAMPRRPRIIGVGYSLSALPTVYPQPHDVPMDAIVTEKGIREPTGSK